MDALCRTARLFLLATLISFGIVITPALANSRVALIIGNGAYDGTTPLPNASNDGRAMAEALRKLDFEVLEGIDLNRGQMQSLIAQFARELKDAEVGLFFYAGHGMQVEGENYLLPINAVLQDDADLPFQTIPVDIILRQMERAVPTRLVFLDACRDNPLARNLASSQGASRSLSTGKGLAQMQAGVGTLIAYATEPNAVALDGQDGHSPFTSAFLNHVQTPGIEIRQLLTRVRQDVLAATDRSQVPWDHSSLTGEFFFIPPEPTLAAAAVPQPETAPATAASSSADKSIEIAFWQTAQQLSDPAQKQAALAAYVKRYPDGEFLPLAELMLATLTPAPAVVPTQETTRNAAPPISEQSSQTEETTVTTMTHPTTKEAPPEQSSTAKLAKAATNTAPTLSAAEQAEQTENALDLSTSQRQRIQRGLSAIGFDTKGADGIFGPNSRAAIQAYQQSRGLETSGFLNKAQWDRLIAESRQALLELDRQAEERQAATRAKAAEEKRRQEAAAAERRAATQTRAKQEAATARLKAEQAATAARAKAEQEAAAARAKAAQAATAARAKAQQAAPVKEKAVNWAFKRCMNNYERTYADCVAKYGEP